MMIIETGRKKTPTEHDDNRARQAEDKTTMLINNRDRKTQGQTTIILYSKTGRQKNRKKRENIGYYLEVKLLCCHFLTLF
jgi:hypothetical protein